LVGLVKGLTGASRTRAGNSSDRANSHAESVDQVPAVADILGGTHHLLDAFTSRQKPEEEESNHENPRADRPRQAVEM
jgi:hypothetical protein